MTRYFEVKVTGCKGCPEFNSTSGCCDFSVEIPYIKRRVVYKQNKGQLTPTCPMWDKTKQGNQNDTIL